MKVVLTSAGSRGDIYPLIYLGRGLKAKGYDIHFSTTPDYQEIIESEGFTFHSAGTDFRELMDSFRGSMGKPLKVMTEGLSILNRELESWFQSLLKAGEGASMLISSGIQFTVQAASETLGIPYHYMVHIPILFPSAYHAPFFSPFQGLPKWCNRFMWFVDKKVSKAIVGKKINEIRASVDLAPRNEVLEHIDMEQMIVAVAPELGPIAPDNSRIGMQCDYLFNPDEGELSDGVKEFLDAGDAPVYFGFGSMTDKHPEKTLSIIFNTVKKLGIRAVISKGWAGYSHHNTPEGIYFAGEEPHGKLFPYMRVIIHHGGAGTTSQAARAGVPQITLPHVLDQYYWTMRIKQLKIGPGGILKRFFSEKSLEKFLIKALSDVDIQKSSKALGETLRKRSGLDTLIEMLDRELKKGE